MPHRGREGAREGGVWAGIQENSPWRKEKGERKTGDISTSSRGTQVRTMKGRTVNETQVQIIRQQNGGKVGSLRQDYQNKTGNTQTRVS